MRRQGEGEGYSPVVSIIIPVYRARYISSTLESVGAQTFADYEVIVVNDGSPEPEELERALATFSGRITYLVQANGGPSAARNTGIRAARGEFLAFLDADDCWHPDYLAEQVGFLRQNPDFDLVYTDGLLVGDSPLAGRTFMERNPSTGEVSFESLVAERCTIILSGVVVRRQAVVAVDLFDERFRYSEDYDLWLRLTKNGARLGYQRKVLLYRRVHGESLSSDVLKLSQSAVLVLEKARRRDDLTAEERTALGRRVNKITAFISLESGKRSLSSRQFPAAAAAFEEANRYYHGWKLYLVLVLLRVAPNLLSSVYGLRRQITADPKELAAPANEEAISLTARAAWYMFAKTLAFAISLALPLLLVRRLNQHDFGVYKQVFLVVGTALNILPIGFGMSAFYFLPRERDQQGQIVFNILLFYTLVSGLALFALTLQPGLLATIFNNPELTQYAPLIGLLILLWVVSSFLEIIVLANQESKLTTVIIIGSQFTKALLLLAAALTFSTVLALIYAAIIQGIVQTVILLFYLRLRFGRFWQGFKWQMMRMQLAYGLPLGLGALIYSMQLDLHHYFVSHRFGPAAFAIYSIGCLQLPLINILSNAAGSVMIPRVNQLQSEGRRREIVELIARMLRKLAAVYFPLYLFLLITGREFITFLFTEQYVDSWPIFAINLTLIPLSLITSAYDPVLRAYAEHRYFLLSTRAVLLVVLLVSLWLGTGRFGLVGTIAVVVGLNFIERLIAAVKVASILRMTRRDLALLKDTGKLALAALLGGGATVLVRSLIVGASPFVILVVCLISFSLVYVGLLFLLRVPTRAEWAAVQQQLGRLRNVVGGRAAAAVSQGDY